MNPLLLQFLSESREITRSIGEQLLQLSPASKADERNKELFLGLLRQVQTLRGNCGLFNFPEMARILHAAEDLLAPARDQQLDFSPELAARLRQANGLVQLLLDDIERAGQTDGSRAPASLQLAESLRLLIPTSVAPPPAFDPAQQEHPSPPGPQAWAQLAQLPEDSRAAALRLYHEGQTLHWVLLTPDPGTAFDRADPFLLVRQTPGLFWSRVFAPQPLPPLAEIAPTRCLLHFHLLAAAEREPLEAHFSAFADEVHLVLVAPNWLTPPEGHPEANRAAEIAAFHLSPHDLLPVQQAAEAVTAPKPSSPAAPIPPDEPLDELVAAYDALLSAQQQILMLEDRPEWTAGRLAAVGLVLKNLARAANDEEDVAEIDAVLAECLPTGNGALLLMWLQSTEDELIERYAALAAAHLGAPAPAQTDQPKPPADPAFLFGRRAEDALSARILKVQQEKVDRLVALLSVLEDEKNALPALAESAATRYAAPELAQEINATHDTLTRLSNAMQETLIELRRMPLSYAFQRFPRMVRNLGRKLGKRVEIIVEGEQVEADKAIVEALAEPLAHIVRNSIIHGIEIPEVRRIRCKREVGVIAIRAIAENGQVLIEITDDGKGIDPTIIKRRAYEKHIFDEPTLEKMDDREAVNLIFAAGLSPAAILDEPVAAPFGMDIVREAVEALGGTVMAESELGLGTTVVISFPLAASNLFQPSEQRP